MMTNKGDAEEKLICPYDKSHHILKHRMQTHLVKCQRNHPGVKIVACSFNATHRIPEPEIKYHLSTCPDRLLLDKFTYKSENVQGSDVLFPIPKLDVAPTECWDDHEEVPTYNPEEHCKAKPIIRNAMLTQSTANRRNFRMEERARMQQFDNTASCSSKPEPSGYEAIQKQRRPAAKSAGIQNDQDNKTDMVEIMEQLKLNADVLVTPKVPLVVPSNQEQPPRPIPADFQKDYPPLSDDVNNQEPKKAPWGASSLAMKGVGLNSPSSRSYGRGTALYKKN